MSIRDFCLNDLEDVKRIHEQSGIDYSFPDLASPLFIVTKVAEVDGQVRACGGLYLQVESYLWLDKNWGDPGERLETIRALCDETMNAAWLKGIDCAVLWLPPGMERFGERLNDLGFQKDRDGWVTYSRKTK